MKKFLKRIKKVSKPVRIIYFLIVIGYLISYFFFAKSIISLIGIETSIRYIILLFFILFYIIYIYICYNKIIHRRYVVFFLLSILSLIFIMIFSLGSFAIDTIYGQITNFRENKNILYTTNLVTLNDKNIDSNSILAMISNENDIEGNILAKELIKKNNLKNEVKTYDDYLEMIYDLYDNKIDGVFVSNTYVTLFSSEEDFENIANDTKVVYEYSKKMKNNDSDLESNKSLSEPFTVLLLGVDSAKEGLDANAAFNGDTLILVTINPKTLNATIFSIPRDTYVPIACKNNKEAKINSSAAYGTSCVIDTIENLTGITIDYYAKINFAGVVSLVDAVGGVEVDVEAPNYNVNHGHNCKGMICEQDSKRRWDEHTIYIKPGLQTLNGEQALAYARCRGVYSLSDIARNKHQQDLIEALAQKIVSNISYSQLKTLLESISNNVSTNMSTSQILSSYNILKDMLISNLNGEDFITIEKTYLEYYDLPVVVPSTGRITSALGYYKGSLDEIVTAMKINLELENPKIIKHFSYQTNENYEQITYGKGIKTGTTSEVLKNFKGHTKAEATSYCQEKKLTCTFETVDETNELYNEKIEEGLILGSNPKANSNIKSVSKVVFYTK